MPRRSRGCSGFIVPVNLSIYVVVGAVPGVLLPLQIQAIDEASKVANLAIVTGIGAFAAMIVSPIAGHGLGPHPHPVRAPHSVDPGWSARHQPHVPNKVAR